MPHLRPVASDTAPVPDNNQFQFYTYPEDISRDFSQASRDHSELIPRDDETSLNQNDNEKTHNPSSNTLTNTQHVPPSNVSRPAPPVPSSRNPFPDPTLTPTKPLPENVDATVAPAEDLPDNHDVLSDDHCPFSQDYDILGLDDDGQTNECDSSSDESSCSDGVISDSEIAGLQSINRSYLSTNYTESRKMIVEDHWSGLFMDPNDDLWEPVEWGNDGQVDLEGSEFSAPIGCVNPTSAAREECSRSRSQRHGGLNGWDYASAFQSVTLHVDDVDQWLCPRLLQEASGILSNVTEEVSCQRNSSGIQNSSMSQSNPGDNLSKLDAFAVFLPTSVLEKIRSNVNRALSARKKELVTVHELRGVIILHVLAASYSSPVSTIAAPENKEFFLQLGISTERICRCEPFPPIHSEATIFALDNDHQRLSSRAVTEYTELTHINNSQKALGPVKNALCASLNPVFLASHYSRPREQQIHIWHRLVQLVQGVRTKGAISPMTDAICAADRGYNSKETIAFLNERLCATGIGTHKRSLDYHFVFGNGPIAKKHKGMAVSEKRCRAVYSATRKSGSSNGRDVEAAVSRESFSGRIAAVYHNNESRFSARKFTLVPKDGFRGKVNESKLREIQVLFTRGEESRRRRSSVSNIPTYGTEGVDAGITAECCMKVQNVLGNVIQLTLLQSEDPGWFLARAFMFTSRTSHSFIRAFARNFQENLAGLSYALAGKNISRLTNPLSQDLAEVEQQLEVHWSMVINTCNIQKGAELEITTDAVTRLMSVSESELNNMRKDDSMGLLTNVGRRAPSSLRKPQLVEKVLVLQGQVRNGTEVLQEFIPEELSADQKSLRRAKSLTSSMYNASLESWVMKPLTATAGTKEGTINEVQVLKSLPSFFEDNAITVWTPQVSSLMKDGNSVPTQKLKVHHVRNVGLLSSRSIEMVADSPDGLLGTSDEQGLTFCAAVEVKTVTSPRTIEEARKVYEKFGAFTELKDIGSVEVNTQYFHSLVTKTEYRLQCSHHAVSLGVRKVLFVVAKGSLMGLGSIIYAALLNFSERIANSYSFCLDCVRVSSFKCTWVGNEAVMIPKEYDSRLQSSHASDLYRFASFYKLSRAYRDLAYKSGPLPPARMIRHTVLVSWNALKGGVDEFSRALTTLAYTNASENPIVSVIGRLVCAQVNNAAVVYRLALAKRKGLIPDSTSHLSANNSFLKAGYVFGQEQSDQMFNFQRICKNPCKGISKS